MRCGCCFDAVLVPPSAPLVSVARDAAVQRRSPLVLWMTTRRANALRVPCCLHQSTRGASGGVSASRRMPRPRTSARHRRLVPLEAVFPRTLPLLRPGGRRRRVLATAPTAVRQRTWLSCALPGRRVPFCPVPSPRPPDSLHRRLTGPAEGASKAIPAAFCCSAQRSARQPRFGVRCPSALPSLRTATRQCTATEGVAALRRRAWLCCASM